MYTVQCMYSLCKGYLQLIYSVWQRICQKPRVFFLKFCGFNQKTSVQKKVSNPLNIWSYLNICLNWYIFHFSSSMKPDFYFLKVEFSVKIPKISFDKVWFSKFSNPHHILHYRQNRQVLKETAITFITPAFFETSKLCVDPNLIE